MLGPECESVSCCIYCIGYDSGIKKFSEACKINLAVRGLHGEGSEAMGDFYQISNQITLESEVELVQQVNEVTCDDRIRTESTTFFCGKSG